MHSSPPFVLKQIAAGLITGAALSVSVLPASAAVDNDLPIRWNSGGAVWSTNQSAVKTFVDSGDVTDRGLAGGISGSGWSADELRTGLAKSYNVDMVGVSRFLYSDAGVKFLQNQTRSYFPYWSMKSYAVQALRSAIIADARDGSISSMGIMENLPTDFRLADTCNTYDGVQNVCDEGRCAAGSAQCTSLLSWYVFLPACVQANQVAQAMPASAPAPSPSVRGLW
ncbi:MAG: alpha/beta hydrolase [Prochlorococcaceae cyanobacterium]